MRSLALFALAAAIAAADAPGTSAHAIRLGLQGMPGSYDSDNEVTTQNGSFTASDDGTWDSAGRLTIGYQWTVDRTRPVSFILGAGLAFTAFEDKQGANKLTVSESGAWVEPGIAWHAAPVFDLEGGLRLGVGAADAELKTPSGNTDYDPRGYGEIGLVVRGIFHFPAGFELGAELGVLSQRAEAERKDNGVKQELTVDTAGATLGLILGWRF